jgi:glyoxylase-like metal-dependent hydrolase (beta-lactamase superfamily II)
VFVEEDRVLFTGDVVMMPAIPRARRTIQVLKTWLSVLDELTALKPLHVVPSHGKLGDATLVARDREFIQAVQARVGGLKREVQVDRGCRRGGGCGDRPAVPEFGNASNAGAMARAAYAEAP